MLVGTRLSLVQHSFWVDAGPLPSVWGPSTLLHLLVGSVCDERVMRDHTNEGPARLDKVLAEWGPSSG